MSPAARPSRPVVNGVWMDVGGGVRACFRMVPTVLESGRTIRVYTCFRTDSRGGPGYAVDACQAVAGVWFVWEAIDGGKRVRTMREAREIVAAYVAGRAGEVSRPPRGFVPVTPWNYQG